VLFSVSTIATLGLRIGVVTGFFAIVDAVLLTPIANTFTDGPRQSPENEADLRNRG